MPLGIRFATSLKCMLAVCASVLTLPAGAAPAADDFARPPVSDQVRFSPDGKRFAARVERQGQLVLVVVDYETNQGRVFRSDRGADLASFSWLTDDLIAIRTNRSGVRAFDLSPKDFQPAYVSVDGRSRINPETASRVVRPVPGSETDLIVAKPRREDYLSQELEVRDAGNDQVKRKITGEAPGPLIRRWVLDRDLVPVAALGYDIRARKSQTWWRESASQPWRQLVAYDESSERGFHPVAVDSDGDLLVLSNLATGRYALHKLDRANGKPGELLAGHPRFDISYGDLIFERQAHHPVGVRIQADREQTYWFDDRRAEVQRLVDASLPGGSDNRLQFLPSGRVLIRSIQDVQPEAYYFFDPKSRSISEWTRSMPWLDAGQLARTQIMNYRTSDGLDIQAYLTMPRDASSDKAPPLLVWVHGGPWARDEWGFDPTVQFIASRGYAVLQPNFRGSTGFGVEFMNAGNRQWGLRMQDDLADAVRRLVAEGKVDPDRVCIGGASYGGYAALMGLVRHPDLFRCAVDLVGPTDLIRLFESAESDTNRRRGSFVDKEIADSFRQRIGDPDSAPGRQALEAQSPNRLAAQIKAPVLLIYGTDDWRVPLEHGTSMRDALQAVGAKFEWKSYAGEGHGIWDRKNRVDMYKRIEIFLNGSLARSGRP